jgi:peptide/nickel transport system substrate-binding protein
VRTKRVRSVAIATVVAAGLALVVSACGGGGGGGGGGTTTTSPSQGKTFANFRIAYDQGIDFLDPALSYTVQGWSIMWNVYLPLLGYKHVNGPAGATLVPYLAKAMPTVTNGGKTYTFMLRKGLKYSDGTPIKASDLKATLERDFKVDSPGVGFFGGIVGASACGSNPKTCNLTGVTADDGTGKITINLTAPQGDFEYIMATTFAALVPAGSPDKDQSTTPLPSSGPYSIQSYKPNKQAIVVRNPNFKASNFGGNVPAGNPDKMTIDILGDPSVALTRTLNGQEDYDFQQPPVDRLSELQSKHANQIKVYTPANTFYFFMNNRQAPFNDVNIRKAVNFAINRQAMVRVQGGLASPTENILPPTYPQYKKTNYYPHNLAKAKQLVQAAGDVGKSVTVWTDDNEARRAPEMGQYMVGVLNSIGFKAKLKTINAQVYWTTVGNQATKAQIGFADWFQDYPHPLDWIDVLLNGTRITKTHNNNYADFSVPAINNGIAQLKRQPTLTPQVNKGWATLANTIMKNYAPWAPYLNVQYIDTFNQDIDLSCYVNHVLYQFDFATICMKK